LANFLLNQNGSSIVFCATKRLKSDDLTESNQRGQIHWDDIFSNIQLLQKPTPYESSDRLRPTSSQTVSWQPTRYTNVSCRLLWSAAGAVCSMTARCQNFSSHTDVRKIHKV